LINNSGVIEATLDHPCFFNWQKNGAEKLEMGFSPVFLPSFFCQPS
jgi:hypothetical protein